MSTAHCILSWNAGFRACRCSSVVSQEGEKVDKSYQVRHTLIVVWLDHLDGVLKEKSSESVRYENNGGNGRNPQKEGEGRKPSR